MIKLFSTENPNTAEIIKQMLEENNAANNKRQNRIIPNEGGGLNRIKKKDKMKMRKELLQKKIHVMKLIKEEEKGTYTLS